MSHVDLKKANVACLCRSIFHLSLVKFKKSLCHSGVDPGGGGGGLGGRDPAFWGTPKQQKEEKMLHAWTRM